MAAELRYIITRNICIQKTANGWFSDNSVVCHVTFLSRSCRRHLQKFSDRILACQVEHSYTTTNQLVFAYDLWLSIERTLALEHSSLLDNSFERLFTRTQASVRCCWLVLWGRIDLFALDDAIWVITTMLTSKWRTCFDGSFVLMASMYFVLG